MSRAAMPAAHPNILISFLAFILFGLDHAGNSDGCSSRIAVTVGRNCILDGKSVDGEEIHEVQGSIRHIIGLAVLDVESTNVHHTEEIETEYLGPDLLAFSRHGEGPALRSGTFGCAEHCLGYQVAIGIGELDSVLRHRLLVL